MEEDPATNKGKEYGEAVSRANNPTLAKRLMPILIMVLVLGLGVLVVNQYLEFRYKARWLSTPCDLCQELNPGLSSCFKGTSAWTYPSNEKNNSKEINYSELNQFFIRPS